MLPLVRHLRTPIILTLINRIRRFLAKPWVRNGFSVGHRICRIHWFLYYRDPVGDRSRSLPKIIPAGVSFQIGKTSTRGVASESAQGIEFESIRGIELESARGIELESARGSESESDRRGVEFESARGIELESARGAESKSDRRGVESDHRGVESDRCGIESDRGNESVRDESTSVRGDESTSTLQAFCSCAEGCEYVSIYQY